MPCSSVALSSAQAGQLQPTQGAKLRFASQRQCLPSGRPQVQGGKPAWQNYLASAHRKCRSNNVQAERIQLAQDIWDSIAAEDSEAASLTPAQVQEVQTRLKAHDQDPSTAVPWEQVRSELLQRNH